MNILFFGDVVGSAGRAAVARVLPEWKHQYGADFIIANGENIAHGKGITRETLQELLRAGVDAVTSGNHIWSFPEAFEILREDSFPLLRPANYSKKLPGSGARSFTVGTRRLLLINLMGQVHMHMTLNSPFEAVDEILETCALPGDMDARGTKEVAHAIVVDWHAETTSEKMAMGWYLDGRVSAVLGTHTHVPTADERVLPCGTAFQCDVGMVGARNSILGVGVAANLKRFRLQVPQKLAVVETSPVDISAAMLAIDASSGLATDIKRLHKTVDIV